MAVAASKEMTQAELKALIKETVQETIRETLRETTREVLREIMPEIAAEMIQPRLDALAAHLENEMHILFIELEQALPDPDEGKELRPEVAVILEAAQQEKAKGQRKLISHEEMKHRLGIDG
jgi:hypothetical protein